MSGSTPRTDPELCRNDHSIESTATDAIDASADAIDTSTDTIDALAVELDALRDRIVELEADLDRKDDRIAELEATLDRVHERSDREDETDRRPIAARLDAHEKKLAANKERIAALQSRELQKGAHLRETTVDVCAIDVPDDRLERVRKDDGNRYFRLPERDDPLDRGEVTLAHGDLLPIQQLARMDDDMLRSTTSSLPARLAAALWRARADPSVGDNPWRTGSADIREYVTAGDMKHWIRRQEDGISDAYAKKLVSRTIDALRELSNHRLAIKRTSQRKNGLEYTERRVLVPSDAAIPGATTGDS